MARYAQLVLFVAPLSTSCVPLASGARDTFVHDNACPAERVVVTARPDIVPHARLDGVVVPTTPPADVAADPARMRIWQADAARAKAEASPALPCEVYEVNGCGRQEYLCCLHPYRDDSPSTSCNAAARGTTDIFPYVAREH